MLEVILPPSPKTAGDSAKKGDTKRKSYTDADGDGVPDNQFEPNEPFPEDNVEEVGCVCVWYSCYIACR